MGLRYARVQTPEAFSACIGGHQEAVRYVRQRESEISSAKLFRQPSHNVTIPCTCIIERIIAPSTFLALLTDLELFAQERNIIGRGYTIPG